LQRYRLRNFIPQKTSIQVNSKNAANRISVKKRIATNPVTASFVSPAYVPSGLEARRFL